VTDSKLVTQAEALGIRLTVTPDNKLKANAPKGVLTTEWTLALTQHKGELIALLPAPTDAAPPKKTRPAWANSRRDGRGLLTTCSQCLNDAVWYGTGCTPYCDSCWPGGRHEGEVQA